MPLTVRLSPKTERTLNALARRQRQSRSDIVREALAHYEATAAVADAGGLYHCVKYKDLDNRAALIAVIERP